MNRTTRETSAMIANDRLPNELTILKERIQGQSPKVRAELEPLIEEVMEDAIFRNRIMLIARDALQQFRTDMASLRLDLEATRRESHGLRSSF